jgi:vacuolar-type H+-ATPase subunit I/STV1
LQLLGIQKELLPMGLAKPEHLYETVKQLVNAFQLGPVSDFFTDPRSPEYQPPQPKPDPAEILAQAELIKAQADVENSQIKTQFEAERIKLQAQKEQTEAMRQSALSEVDRYRAELEAERVRHEAALSAIEAERAHEAEIAKLIGETNLTAAKTRHLGAQTAEILARLGESAEDEETGRANGVTKEA